VAFHPVQEDSLLPPSGASSPGLRDRVLIFESNAAVRASLRDAVLQSGYVGYSAAGLVDAWALVDHGVPFIALLADVESLERYGSVLPHSLTPIRVSSTPRTALLREHRIAPTDHFLQIPVDPRLLGATLGRIGVRRRVLTQHGFDEQQPDEHVRRVA
jgi:hypothetical protein